MAAGFDPSKVGTTSGAFYNALSRLTERGVLLKSERGVYQMKAAAADNEFEELLGTEKGSAK